MIRNFIFLILTVASLAWIVYAGQDIVNFTGTENPERIFGQEDGRVLILNRPDEIDVKSTDFRIQPRLVDVFNLLKSNQSIDERLLISEKKAHIVIEKSRPIDNKRIALLFGDEQLIEVTSKKFLWKEFTILRNKGVLEVLIASEKSTLSKEKWYSFDKKSACSIVQFNHGEPIITDYYQKDGTVSSYARSPFLTTSSQDINDLEMFGNRIPVFISKYLFIEKEYALRHDPKFRESVAKEWANMGLVFFQYKNHAFLLMDFTRGKEPDLFLDGYRNLDGESNRHYKNLQLTRDFPANKKAGVYMRIFDDHVLFAENESALSDLEASLELGQMLSLNKKKTEIVFSQTPQKVCYREWTGATKTAKSTYNGSALEVKVSSASKPVEVPVKENSTAGISLDSPLKKLLVHSTEDAVFAISETNTLFGLKNGKSAFQIELKETTKGKMEWASQRKQNLMITGLTNLHVISKSGEYEHGFPVAVPDGISNQATAFTWKGKINYLIATNSGSYIWLDESGKEIAKGNMEITNLTARPQAWISQRRLFFGFHGDGNFAMVEAEKNTLLRSFPLPIGVHSSILTNEIVFFNLEGNQLYKYNQRGIKKKIAAFQNSNWLKTDATGDGSFYVRDGSELFRYSANGKMLSKTKGNFSDVEYIKRIEKTSKGSIIGYVDGMKNKIELIRSNGNLIPMETNQGQYEFGITTSNGRSKLYTISDKFVIHYVL